MIEPITTVGAGLGILASKDLLNNLLGPSADYIGGEIKNLVEKCNINLNDIFSKAYRKLGKKVDEEGIVPPRVLKYVFDDGRFCEDDLTKEYFAGVLASSRTKDGSDDSGVTFAKLISSLSSYQIRTHYLFYSSLRKKFLPFNNCISPGTDRQAMFLYIPTDSYFESMPVAKELVDFDDKITILAHSMNGLKRNDLIGENYIWGERRNFSYDSWKHRFSEFPFDEKKLQEHGIAFHPTPGGMELFLWVHGSGHYSHLKFLDETLQIEFIEGFEEMKDAKILYDGFVRHKQKMAGRVNNWLHEDRS
jgi:hypothetical protein